MPTILQDKNSFNINDYIGKKRILCIDYGDKRIGLAISDINWIISSPLSILENNNNIYLKLQTIIDEQSVGFILMGAPLNIKGNAEGEQIKKVKEFTDKLLCEIKGDINILFWDERMSTHGAMRYIHSEDVKNKKKKQIVDKVAASFILEGFLSMIRNNITI